MINLNSVLAMVFMVITGFVDGQWFGLVPKAWKNNSLEFPIVLKIFLLYNLGLVTYLIAAHFFVKQGLDNALIMTLIWFVATIISLSIIGGSFATLSTLDKTISIAAVLLVGILYFRGIS